MHDPRTIGQGQYRHMESHETISVYASKRLADQIHIVHVRDRRAEEKALCGYESRRSWQLPLDGLFSDDRICKNCLREAGKKAQTESQN